MASSEVESLKGLLSIASILALVFGILLIIWGALTITVFVGIAPLVFGIVDLIIYLQIKEIIRLVERGQYKEAKDKTMIWMIIGFILGGIIIGIILLIAYLKYDTIIRQKAVAATPPPPPG